MALTDRKNVKYNLASIKKINYKLKQGTDADILALQNDVSALQSDVANNTSDIAQNALDIAQNALDIASNVSDIAQNTLDIASNVSDISDHETRITTLEGSSSLVLGAIYGVDSGNTDTSTTSSVTYYQCGSLITSGYTAIKSDGTSYFIVQGAGTFASVSASQTGVKVKLQYRLNSGTWTDIPTGSTSGNPAGGYQISRNLDTGTNQRFSVNIFARMNITSGGSYQFRMVFTGFLAGQTSSYLGSQADAHIFAQEIKM